MKFETWTLPFLCCTLWIALGWKWLKSIYDRGVIPTLTLWQAEHPKLSNLTPFRGHFLAPAYYLVQHVAWNRHKYCWPPLRRYHYPIWARPFTQNTSWTLMSKYIKSWTHFFEASLWLDSVKVIFVQDPKMIVVGLTHPVVGLTHPVMALESSQGQWETGFLPKPRFWSCCRPRLVQIFYVNEPFHCNCFTAI